MRSPFTTACVLIISIVLFSTFHADKQWRIQGDARNAPPGPLSFIFMPFSANILPNNRLANSPHLQEILDPPLISLKIVLIVRVRFRISLAKAFILR